MDKMQDPENVLDVFKGLTKAEAREFREHLIDFLAAERERILQARQEAEQKAEEKECVKC